MDGIGAGTHAGCCWLQCCMQTELSKMFSSLSKQVGLDLIVEHKHESAACSSDDVGERSLKEGFWTLLLCDLSEAVHGAGVLDVTTFLA